MADDLRHQLGRHQVETAKRKNRPSDPPGWSAPWPYEVWAAGVAALRDGWRPPERRFPVLINPNGPLSSPEKLQELTGMPSVPAVITTTTTNQWSDDAADNGPNPETVQVCDVSWDETERLEEVAECDRLQIGVWFHGEKRVAMRVLSIKEKKQGDGPA